MEKVLIRVSGMSCSHCEKRIANALTEIGAVNVKASSETNTVEVEYDLNTLTLQKIEEEIVETGYEVI